MCRDPATICEVGKGYIEKYLTRAPVSLLASSNLSFSARDSAQRIFGRHIVRVEYMGQMTKRGGGGKRRKSDFSASRLGSC